MKPIFHDNYPQNFYSIVNKHNYAVLLSLVGEANQSKVACLAPECSSNFRQLEKKKSMWVHFLINALSAGISLDDVPDGCSCDELACACEQLEFDAIPVETGEIEVALNFTGANVGTEDLTLTTKTGDIDTVIAAADQGAIVELGKTKGKYIDLHFTAEGSVGFNDQPHVITELEIDGDVINQVTASHAFPPVLLQSSALPGYRLRLFLPPYVGLTRVAFSVETV